MSEPHELIQDIARAIGKTSPYTLSYAAREEIARAVLPIVLEAAAKLVEGRIEARLRDPNVNWPEADPAAIRAC